MKRFPRRPRAIPVLVLLALLRSLTPAQEVNEKAQRYYDSLLKRPAPGAVFDRFYSAWLDTKTIDELETWLKQKADAPGAPSAGRLLLAFFYARQNDNVKAIAQFRLAVEKDANNPDAWYQKALIEARTLDFDGALASVAKAAAANPPAAMLTQIRQMQGRWLARNGKTDEAVKVWQALIAANPNDEELREDLIELQITEGLNEQALATAQALLESTKDPYRKVQRRMRIGDIYQRSGNRDKAIETYLLCLDETGSDSWLEKEILSQVEQTFRKDDAVDALKTEYQKLAVKYPQRVSLRRQYARLLAETRETDPAVQEFTKILELTPGSRELREAFVELLVQAKKSKEAATQMQELIRLNPADIELLVKLADLYFEMQQPDDCRRTVDTFLAKSDQSEASWLRAAGMLERYKLTDPAIELFRKATEKFAGSETAADALAVALYKSGKKDEAKAAWRKLAEGADKTRLMNVARSASVREEHALAFELLTARLANFGTDPLFLQQLCDTAQRVDKYADAVPWARTLVGLSKDAVELEGNLTLLTRLAGKADKVEALLNDLKTSAQTPQEKCLLAELLDNSGDAKAAETLLREVEAAQPELSVAVLVRLQIQRGDPAAAAESMKRLIESPGGRKSVHVQRLVDLYERAGKAKDALTWIPEWKKLSPGSNLPWQKEAALHFQSGNNKEALRSLRQASQEFEDNTDIKAMLAEAFRQEGRLADAERLYTVLYEDAKELGDKIRWAGSLAEVAKASGKTGDLVEMFEERRKANRTSLQPLLALAEIHRVSDNYEGRRRMLLEAARLKENDLDLLMEVARIEEAEEDYPHTLETLKKAESLDKSGKVKQRIARVYFKSGDKERGMAALRQMADEKFDPRLGEALAESLCDQDFWDEAAAFLQPLLQKHPDDYRLHYLAAVALEESSKMKESAFLFQRLLGMRKELASQTSASAQAVIPNAFDYYESMRPYVPAETLEILRISGTSWQAYYHRQNNGSSNQSIRIPGTVEDSRRMSLIHLASMAQNLDDTEKAALMADLKAQGIRSTDLLVAMMQGERIDQSPDYEALLEKTPDDEVLLSLAAIWGNRYGNSPDPTLDLKLYQKLKTSRPELAWIAGMRLGTFTEPPEAAKAYAETVAAVEKLESPPQLVLQAAISALGVYDNNNDAIPEENRKIANRLRAKLPGWYRKADPKSGQAQYAFISIATQMAREDDLAPLVKLFDEEITAVAADPNRNTQNMYFGRRNNGLLEPLDFPPQRLTDYSVSVLGMLNGSSDNYYGRRMDMQPDKLKSVLASAKDPVLKLLLTAKAEDDDATTKLAAEMTSQPEPSLNAFLLHASWLAEKEKFDEACALLRRAQYLPMTREMRKLVDSSMISWAMEANDKEALKEDSALLTGAREAVLRMRREALTPAHRGELAGCMEQLGLKKEAERLAGKDAAVTTPSFTSSRSTRYYSSSPFSSSNRNGGRIDQLIVKGKREEALKELTRDLKNFTKQWIANSNNARYQTREWMEVVSRHGFNKQLMESMKPAEGAPPDAIIQWAAVQDIFGETKKAVETYSKAVELKPKDVPLRQAYLTALVTQDPAKAREALKTLDPVLVLGVSSSLANIMSNTNSNAERLTLLEFMLNVLEKTPEEERIKQNLEALLNAVEYGVQYSDGEMGSLYQSRPTGSRKPKAQKTTKPATASKPATESKAPDPAKRRLELHQKLTSLLMKSPSTARHAFELYAGVALQVDAKAAEPELDRLAHEALETEAKQRARSSSGPYYSRRVYYGRGGTESIRTPDPESYLVERAWAQKKPELITNDLLPRLKSSSRSSQAKKIEESMPLYFCADSEFSDVIAAYIKKQSRLVQPGNTPEYWNTVFHILELRKLDVDLTDAVLDGLKGNRGYYNGNEFSHVVGWAVQLQKSKGAKPVRELFEKVAVHAMGPRDKRAAMIEKNYNPSSYSYNTPNGMIMQWFQFLRNAWQTEELVFPAAESYNLEFVRYAGTQGQQDQLYNYGHRLSDSSFYADDPDKAVQFFRSTPVVAALKDFMAFASPSSQRCLLVDILQAMTQGDRKPLREAFAKEPRTFGTELIDLVLDKGDVVQSVLSHLAANLEEIKKLEAHQQRDLAGMYSVAKRYYSSSSKTTDAERAVKEWSEGVLLGSSGDRVTKLLATKSLKGQSGDYDFAQNTLTPLLTPMIRTSPDDAVKVFLKVRTLFADCRKSGLGSNVHYGDNSSVLGEVLSSIVSNGDADSVKAASSTISFVLRSTLPREGFPVEWKSNVISAIAAQLRILGTPEAEKSDKSDKPADDKKAAPKFSVRVLLPKLAEVPGVHPGAMIASAASLFADKQLPAGNDDIKWLEEQAASGTSKDLASALIAGFRIARDSKPKNGSAVAAEVPDHQKVLLQFVEDAEIPLPVRLSIAGELISSSSVVSAPVRYAAVTQLGEAWRQSVPVSGSHCNNIVSGLVALDSGAGAQPAEAFRNAAMDIMKSWQRVSAAGRSSNGSYGYQVSTSDVLAGGSAFSLAMSVGDEAILRQVLINGSAGYAKRAWFIRLVKTKRFEIAQMMLRTSNDGIYDDTEKGEDLSWNPALAETAKEFTATLNDAEEKYLAELLIASLPDSKQVTSGDLKGKVPLQLERLKEIASRLPEKFSNPLSHERALVILLGQEMSIPLVDTSLAGWAANQTFGTIAMLDNQVLRTRRAKLLAAHIKRTLAKGDLSVAKEAITQLTGTALSQRSSYYTREAARPILTLWQTESQTFLASPDAAVRKTAREIWRELAFVRDTQSLFYNTIQNRALQALFFDAMDDKAEEFSEAVAQLPEERRKAISQELGSALETALSTIKFRWPADKAEAAKLKSRTVLRMMKNTVAWPFEFTGLARTLPTLVTSGWLRREDVIAEADALMERHPRDGRTGQELAVLFVDDGKPDQALKLLDKAGAQLPADDPVAATWMAVTRSGVLEKLDRHEEALALVNAISAETLDLKEAKPDLRRHVLESRVRIGLEVTWRKGGKEAVMAQAVEQMGSDPKSREARNAIASAFSLIASKQTAAGDKVAALHSREIAFLIREKIAASNTEKTSTGQTAAGAALREARAAVGDGHAAQDAVPADATWRYYEGVKDFDKWMNPDYDDSAWKTGQGPIGMGISGSVLKTQTESIPEVMAFRTKFTLPNPDQVQSLTVNYMRGDGVVMYLNGKEIRRSNLAAGDLTESTRATLSVTDTEATEPRSAKIAIDKLPKLEKENVLSAVLYQFNSTSTGMVFSLSAKINELETKELSKGIDKVAMEKSLGSLWSALPEAFRKSILK